MVEKIKRKKIASIVFLIFGLLGILIVVLLLSMLANRKMNEYVIKNEQIYVFFGDERFDYDSEVILNRDNDITNIKIDGQVVKLDSEPIFIKDKDEVILPSNMSLVSPLEGVIQKKISYFSRVTSSNDDIFLNTLNLKDYSLYKVFMYDGKDLYFFCDDVTIMLGNEKIEVPALSYVICEYTGNTYIFNYTNKNVMVYETNGKTVKATDGNYVVDLKYDLVEFNDNSVLLVKNVGNLPNLKG